MTLYTITNLWKYLYNVFSGAFQILKISSDDDDQVYFGWGLKPYMFNRKSKYLGLCFFKFYHYLICLIHPQTCEREIKSEMKVQYTTFKSVINRLQKWQLFTVLRKCPQKDLKPLLQYNPNIHLSILCPFI